MLFRMPLSSLFLAVIFVGCWQLSPAASGQPVKAVGSQVQVESQKDVKESYPLTDTAKKAIRALDDTGGDVVDEDLALMILGVLLIASYRLLQGLASRAKTPVGSIRWSILSKIIAVLFGSHASWSNRILIRWAPRDVRNRERRKVLDKVKHDNPLIAHDLEVAERRR